MLSKQIFIKATEEYNTFERNIPAYYFRRAFCVDAPTVARVTVAACGFYEIFFNGKKITRGFLSPYISNTDDYIYYDEYEISLNQGENVLGFLLGSWLVFSLVRRFGVKLVEVFFDQKKLDEIRILRNPKKVKLISFLLMLIPGTPKDMLSYFSGLTKLTTIEWLTIVAVGRIPSLVTSTLTGAAAGEKNYLLTGIMIALTLVISLLGILYYRKLSREEEKE